MKKIIFVLFVIWGFFSCENPYENVSQPKHYNGDPFVSLSSEQAIVRLGVDESINNTKEAGVYKDSLVLSQKLNRDIIVTLELVAEETEGEVNTNFSFQQQVTIKADNYFGSYTATALTLPDDELSKYKLAIRIKEVNDKDVIAGLYGLKKENEDRKKRFKTFSFQK